MSEPLAGGAWAWCGRSHRVAARRVTSCGDCRRAAPSPGLPGGAVLPFVLQGRRLVGTCPSGGRPLLAGSPRGAKPALGDSQTRGVAMPPAAGRVREGPGGPGHTAQARLQWQNLLPELWAGGRGSRCHRGLLRAPGVSSTSARLGAPGVPGPVASSLPPSSLGPLPRVCVSTRHLPLTRSPVTLEGDPPWWPRLAQLHLRRPTATVACHRPLKSSGFTRSDTTHSLQFPPQLSWSSVAPTRSPRLTFQREVVTARHGRRVQKL